jgi:hypothetical protein
MIKLSTIPVLKRFLGTDDGLELKVNFVLDQYSNHTNILPKVKISLPIGYF